VSSADQRHPSDDLPAAVPPVAEADGVSKRFGATEALRGVSLAVANRESRALVGRNGAGKSTLVSLLTGLNRPDSGEIRFDGAPAPDVAARAQWRERAACVYQHSMVIPSLTVGENLFLNAHPGTRRGLVSWRALAAEGRRLLDEWRIDVDVDAPASGLSVGQRQLVEIARALRLGSRFIILDEPTARLDASEVARLFEHVQRLRAGGVAFLYISHHLEEIHEVCDTVTVLRDGAVVMTDAVANVTQDEIVDAMVGPSAAASMMGPRSTLRARQTEQPLLQVRDLTIEGWCDDVSFEVLPAEFVGLAGLAGCGKAQVADAIAGLIAPDRGEVLVGDRPVPPGRVDRAIDYGIGLVPGDRHARGLCANLSTEENLTLSVLDRLGRFGLVDPSRRTDRAERLIADLDIVASSPRQPIAELSGGNQQKAVLGRALASEPRVLVLVSPTAGVDVESRRRLLEAIQRAGDLAVVVVSDDLDELAICDRVIVMFGGKVTKQLAQPLDDNELVAAMEGVQQVGGRG
jgi:simple sugar transport system ATP-binding protein